MTCSHIAVFTDNCCLHLCLIFVYFAYLIYPLPDFLKCIFFWLCLAVIRHSFSAVFRLVSLHSSSAVWNRFKRD